MENMPLQTWVKIYLSIYIYNTELVFPEPVSQAAWLGWCLYGRLWVFSYEWISAALQLLSPWGISIRDLGKDREGGKWIVPLLCPCHSVVTSVAMCFVGISVNLLTYIDACVFQNCKGKCTWIGSSPETASCHPCKQCPPSFASPYLWFEIGKYQSDQTQTSLLLAPHSIAV